MAWQVMDRTQIPIPIEIFADTSVSEPTRLYLLFLGYPHVRDKDPRMIADALNVPPDKYDDWRRNTLKKVIGRFDPLRKDLPELQRRALQDLTGDAFTNPSYAQAYREKKFGKYEPIICIPREDPKVKRLIEWYPDLFDLTIPKINEFWKTKLPRALAGTDWAKEFDQDVRSSAFVLVAAHKYIDRPTLKDAAIGLLLSKSKELPHHKGPCEMCRRAKDVMTTPDEDLAADIDDALVA